MAQTRLPLRKTLVCPITAVAFFTSPRTGRLHLLVGEDVNINIFDVESGALVRSVPVLNAQPVHGIFCGGGFSSVLAWGNTAMVRVGAGVVDGWIDGDGVSTIDTMDEVQAPDWIYDVKLSPWDDGVGVLVTAHNEAVLVRCVGERGLEFGRVASPSRPMLYSANLSWVSASSVLVAAGTVFGEIHMWQCHIGADGQVASRMQCVLTGHEGSIFGVSLYETGGRRLLASCSDDRTIRIWDVTEDAEESQESWTDDVLHAPRETGFTTGEESVVQQQGDDGHRQVAMAMGHISRIWSVRFLDDETLCSFGEDCTILTWSLTFDPEKEEGQRKRQGKLVRKDLRTAHEGRHIWASAARRLPDGSTLMATGGADGRIVLAETGNQGQAEATISLAEIMSSVGLDAKKDRLRQFAYVDDDSLLVATSTGHVLHGAVTGSGDGGCVKWTECAATGNQTFPTAVSSLGVSTVMRRVAGGTAVIGTSQGCVFIASRERVEMVAQVDGSVWDIFPLDPIPWASLPGGKDVPVLVSLAGAAAPVLVTLGLAGSKTSQETITALDPRCMVTSAAYVGAHLLIGSRHGFLAVLARTNTDNSWTIVEQGRQSNDSITAIVALSPSRFLTTSRDGKYRIYTLTHGLLSIVHEETPPLGPNLDAAWLSNEDGAKHVVLAGFRNGAIVVHDQTARVDLAAVDCGGPHRTFTLTQGLSSRIAFNRAASLHMHAQASPPQRILRLGLGGREIRAIDGITLANGRRYVAAGGEDNIVRVHVVVQQQQQQKQPPGSSKLRCVAVLKKHSSGLQQVKWFVQPDGSVLLLTSSGHEELFLWRVQPLGDGDDDDGQGGIGVVFEAALDDRTRDEDLRITDFSVDAYASAYVDHPGGSGLRISAAFSNSVFKTYEYRGGKFTLVAEGGYTGACLTQIVHLGGGGGGVLTAATDGFLTLWSETTTTDDDDDDDTDTKPVTPHEYTLVKNIRVHRGSIKALAMVPEHQRTVVVTGGDDNALAITDLATTRTVVFGGAHAASINGVAALEGGGAVSCSNDQRVRWWRWRQEDDNEGGALGGGGVVLEKDVHSGVADPGDLCVLDDGGVVVAGVGMEMWEE